MPACLDGLELTKAEKWAVGTIVSRLGGVQRGGGGGMLEEGEGVGRTLYQDLYLTTCWVFAKHAF